MNPINRFQAIIRHPEYRSDPRLSLRWTLNWDVPDQDADGKRNHLAFLLSWGITKAVRLENKEEVYETLRDLENGHPWIFINQTLVVDPAQLHSGPLMNIPVDLKRPTNELLKELRWLIDSERKKRKILRTRTRPHMIDPWGTWDQMQIPGNTLFGIARSMSREADWHWETAQYHLQIRRAYKKAVSMIEEVGQCRRNNPELVDGVLVSFFTEAGKKASP